jgi:WD40 repeat protein
MSKILVYIVKETTAKQMLILFVLFYNMFLDLNLIDWGPNNCIAIALGVDLYFWNYDTLETKQLVDLLDNCYVSSVAWMHEQLDVLAVGTSDTTVKVSTA